MAAVAIVSAVLTATVVIGAGEAWLNRQAHAASANTPATETLLIQTAG